jgi:hypothetical protein
MGANGDSAQADSSVQGWPALIAEVQKTFNLLRDVFGYALPGAVFLAIGLLSGRLSLKQLPVLLYPYQLPSWAAVLVTVTACYVIGQIMASIAYTPGAVLKYFRARKNPDDTRVTEHPTEISAARLEIRRLYPGFFVSLDRRETMVIFAGGTMAALLSGVVVFCLRCLSLSQILALAGLILLVDFWTGMPHLKRVQVAIGKAYTEAQQHDQAAENGAAKRGEFSQACLDLLKATTAALQK